MGDYLVWNVQWVGWMRFLTIDDDDQGGGDLGILDYMHVTHYMMECVRQGVVGVVMQTAAIHARQHLMMGEFRGPVQGGMAQADRGPIRRNDDSSISVVALCPPPPITVCYSASTVLPLHPTSPAPPPCVRPWHRSAHCALYTWPGQHSP